jgi:hypothetical protein
MKKYFASLTGKEKEGFEKLEKSQPVNFCPMYKSDDLIKKVLENFDYVVFDSLGFLFNKGIWKSAKYRKRYKVTYIKHVFKYCLKLLKFKPHEATMFDTHTSITLTILLSIPIYVCCLIKRTPFNIVVWNAKTYRIFKTIFIGYKGVSIASGWEYNFIESVIKKEKYIHCFGVDGKEIALKHNLRYDTFEWTM